MSVQFTFTALGKPIDVHFTNTGNHQHLVIHFDSKQIIDESGDILEYPESFLLLNGAAAEKWEKKQLRLIAEEAIASLLGEKIEWQVGYDSDDKPAFGIDIFDNESEAQEHAETLSKQGEQGITLTKFVDTAPVEIWHLKDDEWM